MRYTEILIQIYYASNMTLNKLPTLGTGVTHSWCTKKQVGNFCNFFNWSSF